MKKLFISIIFLFGFSVLAFSQTVDTIPIWEPGAQLVDSIIKESPTATRHVGIGVTGNFPIIGGQVGYRTVTIEGSGPGGGVLELINVSQPGSTYDEVAKIEMLNLNSTRTEVLGRALINVETDWDTSYSRIGFLIRNPGDPDALYVGQMKEEGMGIGTIDPNRNGQARTLTVASGNTCAPFTCVARVGTAAIEIIGNRQGVDGAAALLDFQNEDDAGGYGPQRIASILARTDGANDQGSLEIYTSGPNGLEKQVTISLDGDITFWKLAGSGTAPACIDWSGRLMRC